jgi:hypothetical protein
MQAMLFLRPSTVAGLALIALACATPGETEVVDRNEIAERYVKLALALGEHDADFVDAYYGEPAWREEAREAKPALDDIAAQSKELLERLAVAASPSDDLERLRDAYLSAQLRALAARVEMLGGKSFTFDEESRALYDAEPPTFEDAHFDALLAQLEPLLPGEGTLEERYTAFRSGFIIPTDRLDDVFSQAIAECKRRTARYIELPAGESFAVEYVNDKPWSGYNWYQGGYRSLIQVNTDLPIYIDRAVDLACHEGYPGHHVYNLLLEHHLARGKGWVEFTVYPLFSPQSLIAEGTANFGIEMAFPGNERVEYEREVLFPLAGLDANEADRFYRAAELVAKLDYAGNEAARRYLDGEIDADAAAEYLARYALMSPERAAQRVRFIDTYRSYVINYNLGQDLVKAYLKRRAPDPEQRWAAFSELLSSPRLPSGL